MNLCFLDFEFNGISDPKLNLVSVAAHCTENGTHLYSREFWLYGGAQKRQAQSFFRKLINDGFVFVAYVMEAEARSLMSLFDVPKLPKSFKAIDLYLEYRCLLNHNHELAYGSQYIKGKIIKTSPPPSKWEVEPVGSEDSEEDEAHHKPSFSLASALYKMLDIKIDAEEKDEVRDIIIKGDPKEILEHMGRIQKYNMSDVLHLPRLMGRMLNYFKTRADITPQIWIEHALSRGAYAVSTAQMLQLGYPVNHEKISAFTSNVKEIINAAIKDCLEASPAVDCFRFVKKQDKYVANEKRIREWAAAQEKPYWRKTKGKALSISKDAFGDWYDSQSDGFAGAYCRYLKTKQSLNGFVSTKSTSKGKFSDFVGSDGRVRPYFGIYGSQASRSQPGAVGFIPLKAHWMRNFIEAPAGMALAGVDYASQEFLIAAILSQDQKMMDAYASGDVYLAFGKSAKMIPPEGTKVTHAKMREVQKQIVLGMSYDMSARGLAPRISQASGEFCSEERAQGYIDLFFATYSDYAAWKDETTQEYETDCCLALSDGWLMWGDNDNRRSVGNFPVQGHGAVVMREAVRLSQSKGLDIIYTLHDALYIQYKSFHTSAIATLMMCMAVAFETVMGKYGKTIPIRLEGESWSVDYKEKVPAPIQNIVYMSEYSDTKGEADLKRYRKFFTPQAQEIAHGISESSVRENLL